MVFRVVKAIGGLEVVGFHDLGSSRFGVFKVCGFWVCSRVLNVEDFGLYNIEEG